MDIHVNLYLEKSWRNFTDVESEPQYSCGFEIPRGYIDVLGEILRNYPAGIEGNKKKEIINEMHNLGMRCIQAIIDTIKYLEDYLVECMIQRLKQKKKTVNSDEVETAVNSFLNFLIFGVARGMIHQIAGSLNSEHLLPASLDSLKSKGSISSRLILLDLKLNYLKKPNYSEIEGLKKEFDRNKETTASRLVDAIVSQYLNYNKCNSSLRSKLCSLCGLKQQESLLGMGKNLLS